MRRADRLFDIIQSFRATSRPITAALLAARLEVTVRTIYRDIAVLQARRVPIEGEAGVGYVLRRGFDLPPLMFTADEIDAIAVGARLVRRLRDPGLQAAADSVLAKVTTILPEALRPGVAAPPFWVSDGAAQTPEGIDLAAVRHAIRARRKLRITYMDADGPYMDADGRHSQRTVWPIAMAYYVDVTLLGAWCELRSDYRHFRVERVLISNVLDAVFSADGGRLMAGWLSLQNHHQAG